jgi:hypothetical protein
MKLTMHLHLMLGSAMSDLPPHTWCSGTETILPFIRALLVRYGKCTFSLLSDSRDGIAF